MKYSKENFLNIDSLNFDVEKLTTPTKMYSGSVKRNIVVTS